MKNFILMLAVGLLTAVSLNVKAQTTAPVWKAYKATNDTLINTTSVTYLDTVVGLRESLCWQTTVTKVSGTVAGSLIVLGSVDGVGYDTVGTRSLLDQTPTYGRKVESVRNYCRYYKVIVSTTGGTSAHRLWRRYQ